ncbi:plant/protein (DUF789) [Rhynchospora pubera]|uniref:Plant/protein (DUF789) n=1 Tax=Rhynchospora pubera TaxID=906938 RepID=A0AAV8HSX0_9POAL|nr:plant/protein (DUF789) [Rhynchospora pubera]
MVIGTASSSAAAATSPSSHRLVGVDRFYSPPAVRRQQELQKQKQFQQQSQKDAPEQVKPERFAVDGSGENCANPAPDSSASNLDWFLHYTTPSVAAQYWPKTSIKGWKNGESAMSSCMYYCLEDLWESFKEWSAYGCGVPVVLNGSNNVDQYYVPYLSAIQLYANSKRTSRTRRHGEESSSSEGRSSSSEGSSSDGSIGSNGEAERTRQRGISCTNRQYNENGGFTSDNGSFCTAPASVPVFEYFERDPPYCREPLTDKISILAKQFPDLKTYRSCDLHPSSWFSVAWYPIYRIPTGPTLKDVDACFLTYHRLAKPSNTSSANGPLKSLSLHSFGLASYKLKSNIWMKDEPCGSERLDSLLQEAENWLRLVNVEHPDFRFFLTHYNPNWR